MLTILQAAKALDVPPAIIDACIRSGLLRPVAQQIDPSQLERLKDDRALMLEMAALEERVDEGRAVQMLGGDAAMLHRMRAGGLIDAEAGTYRLGDLQALAPFRHRALHGRRRVAAALDLAAGHPDGALARVCLWLDILTVHCVHDGDARWQVRVEALRALARTPHPALRFGVHGGVVIISADTCLGQHRFHVSGLRLREVLPVGALPEVALRATAPELPAAFVDPAALRDAYGVEVVVGALGAAVDELGA